MKASEVFDLPLEANDEGLYQSDGSDEYVGQFNTPEQAAIAEVCINHADALADALELMIKSNWSAASEKRASQVIAGAALAAYRGAK